MPIGSHHAGRALVDLLHAHGVTHVFGLPGGQTAALYDAIDHDDRLTHVGVQDERTAAYAADAYARLTGRVGVCDATVGPGTAKLPSGLGEAFNSSIPVLALVSDLPTATDARRHRGATSQALDQESLLRPVTKWVGTLRRIEDLGPVIRRAFREATSGRPGPVAVILPQDLLDGPPPDDPQHEDPHASRFGRFPSTPTPPSPTELDELAELIDGASRPLVVLGGGGHRDGVREVTLRLMDAGIPVTTTLSGKGAVDETHPMAAGVLGSLGSEAANAIAREADVLILAGTKWGSGTTYGWSLPLPDQRVAQVDIDPVELGRDRPVSVALCADALATLDAVPVADVDRSAWTQRVADLRAGWEARRSELCASSAVPIDPQRVMAELGRAIRPGDVAIADASLSSGWVGAFLQAGPDGPRTLFPRGLAGLGWAIPAVIGAAEAGAPRVIAVMGDGAAPYAIGELAGLVERGTPVLMIVLNNGSYGWIRWYRRVAFGRGWEESDLPETSFTDVAAAYGLWARRVDDPDQLGATLAQAPDGPALVEVMTSTWQTPLSAHRDALERDETADY